MMRYLFSESDFNLNGLKLFSPLGPGKYSTFQQKLLFLAVALKLSKWLTGTQDFLPAKIMPDFDHRRAFGLMIDLVNVDLEKGAVFCLGLHFCFGALQKVPQPVQKSFSLSASKAQDDTCFCSRSHERIATTAPWSWTALPKPGLPGSSICIGKTCCGRGGAPRTELGHSMCSGSKNIKTNGSATLTHALCHAL